MRTRQYVLAATVAAAALAVVVVDGCRRAQTGDAPVTRQNPQPATRPMPPLTEAERSIIIDKGTERPFTGKYWNNFERGVYICRQCGAPLYLSETKFESHCGWPSFDDEIAGAVRKSIDADGRRVEITCANCGGHLGHVFTGEGYTPRDTRHCVNSASIVLVPEAKWKLQRAIFAGGCFWGVDHYFRQLPGVLAVRSGYTGGSVENPTYEQVCTGKTGHAEAVEVVFDPQKTSYEELARAFFEIHDPTTPNRQGPDVGTQYRSAVFVVDDQQRQTVQRLIEQLRANGYDVSTEVAPAGVFWPAEDYHQDYLTRHPGRYDCHVRVDRFKTPAASPRS
jgi:peptide methionine sulfoxide reductase msrA/msrB